jgi:ribosomal protein S13
MNTPRKPVPTTPEERFAYASSSEAAPEVTEGAISCTTPEAIERFRMITCLTGLKLESKGIRVRRGQSCLTIARRDYGIVAKDAATAYARMLAKMLDLGIIPAETVRR